MSDFDSDFYLTLKIQGKPGTSKIQLRDKRVLSNGKWKVALVGLTYTKSPVTYIENQYGIWPNNVPSASSEPITVSVFHSSTNLKVYDDSDGHNSRMPASDTIRNGLVNIAFSRPGVRTVTPIETYCTLPAGYYENPSDFASALLASFNLNRGKYTSFPMELHYDYNPLQKSVTITGADAYVFYNGNDFIKGMGLEGGEIVTRKDAMVENCLVYYGNLHGANGHSPKVYKYLNVTTNFVKYERVGERMEQLLATVPIKMVDEERFEFVPRHRQYKSVSCRELNYLNFSLTDSNCEPIRISHGRMILKLHFKKATSIK